MNSRQSRVVLATEPAVAFALTLRDPPQRVTEAAMRLQTAREEVHLAAVEQMSAKKTLHLPGAALDRAKKLLVRKHLDPIAADGLEMFAGLPGIEESFKVPRIKDPPAKHIQAAERVRRVAAAHEQEFITERNYREDFLEQFDRAVENLEAAGHVDVGSARARYSRATADVKEGIARLRRAFDVLDTRIHEEYLDHPHVLKRWRRASRRLPAQIGRPKKQKAGLKRADRIQLLPSPREIPPQHEGPTAQ